MAKKLPSSHRVKSPKSFSKRSAAGQKQVNNALKKAGITSKSDRAKALRELNSGWWSPNAKNSDLRTPSTSRTMWLYTKNPSGDGAKRAEITGLTRSQRMQVYKYQNLVNEFADLPSEDEMTHNQRQHKRALERKIRSYEGKKIGDYEFSGNPDDIADAKQEAKENGKSDRRPYEKKGQ